MDDTDDEDRPNPQRREGSFLVFDFEGCGDHLPGVLEEIADWLRACAEYSLEQLTVIKEELGCVTVAVTVREVFAGDVIQALAQQGYPDLAAEVADLVTELGTREGLRRAGLCCR